MGYGKCSNWSEVISGIPQGSVLGPLLFTIFINDLPLSITSHIQIFADDTKIYNTVQDSGILKNYLDKLVLWSKEWLLSFNIDKCNILQFGKNKPNIEYNMEEKIISAFSRSTSGHETSNVPDAAGTNLMLQNLMNNMWPMLPGQKTYYSSV